MTTTDCLQQYRDSVLEIEFFISEAHIKDASGNFIHPEKFRDFVISSAVVRFSIAWETFLENIYCAFILGEKDTQGGVVPCCVSVSNLDQAHKLLIGTNKYFDWINPDLVVQLSALFLNPDNPIKTAINSTKSDVLDLKTIRNAAAHMSSTTQQKLDSVASRLYGHQAINSKVSEVVSFVRSDGKTQWEYLRDLLDVATENIAKGVV